VIALLSLVTVVSWGTWMPLAQAVPGVRQRARTFYVTVGNFMFAAIVLAATGGHLAFGWRTFWLPLAGGVLWTAGNYSAFKAIEAIGLARAAGSWTALNIIIAFAWGAALFGELDGLGAVRLALLAGTILVVIAGVLLIIRSQGAPETGSPSPGARPSRGGLLWASAAGVLWGSYFVPAQWAAVPAQISNFPLAIGMLAGGVGLALSGGQAVWLRAPAITANLAAGALWGIGNLVLLSLVKHVGTGVGFTIAQLSLLVNASIGIWVFKVPKPGTPAAKLALAGILIAGAGGAVIGALR
jgi:glucose uptake protein GlcU